MKIPHPWHELRDRHPHVRVDWMHLPAGVWGLTDGIARIWLHKGLSQRERRSTLAHELEHHRQGHAACQPSKVERHVRAMAAQWLLPDIRAVMDAVIFHGGINDHAAEDLWVDLETLQARFDARHTPMQEVAWAENRWRNHEHD